MSPRAQWVAILGAVAAYDYARDRRHDDSTLSAVIRATFCTETALGRAVFTATLLGGAAWLHGHIIKPISESSPTLRR